MTKLQRCDEHLRAAWKLSSLLVSFQTAAADLQRLSGTLSVQMIAGCRWYTTKWDSKCCLGLQLDYIKRTTASSGTDSTNALQAFFYAALFIFRWTKALMYLLLFVLRESQLSGVCTEKCSADLKTCKTWKMSCCYAFIWSLVLLKETLQKIIVNGWVILKYELLHHWCIW